MIKFESNEGKVRLQAIGNPLKIATDVCVLIGTVYDEFKKSNDDVADAYKTAIQSAVKEGVMFEKESKDQKEEEPKCEDKETDDVTELLNKLIKVLSK